MRSPVSQVMLKPAGIRIRMSWLAMMVAVVASSVIVSVAIAVGGSPIAKVWLVADDSVGATIVMVLSS